MILLCHGSKYMTVHNLGDGLLIGSEKDQKPKPREVSAGNRFIELSKNNSKFTMFICDGLQWLPQPEFQEVYKNKTIDYNLNTIKNLPAGFGGESNTAANVGISGIGLFKQKFGVELDFNNIDVGSTKLTIAQNLTNSTVVLDIDEANLTLSSIGGTASKSQIPAATAYEDEANIFTLIQKFEVGIKVKPITVPTTDSSYGIFYSDSADTNKPKFKKPDGTVIDLTATSGASTSIPFVTIGNDGSLSEERALTAGDGITITDGGVNSTVTIAQNYADLGRKRVAFVEDFFSDALTSNGNGVFTTVLSGVGASINNLAVSETGVFGVWQLETGTDTTGNAAIQAGNLSSFSLGQGTTTVEWYINIPTLSTAGEEFSLRIGLMDSVSGASTDGVYFRYDRPTTTNWRISARANSVSTDATTATAVGTSWTRLKIVVNAAGTSVSFFVNGTELSGSPLTTNIPTGVGRELTVAASLIKSAGTTTRVVNFDYVAFDIDLTTPR